MIQWNYIIVLHNFNKGIYTMKLQEIVQIIEDRQMELRTQIKRNLGGHAAWNELENIRTKIVKSIDNPIRTLNTPRL